MKLFTRRHGRGFTLVEVMIVVAIIALLAAIAIPNLLRARHNANESAAIGGLHTLVAALESFRAAQVPTSYPESLDELSDATPPYADASLTSGEARQGYVFDYTQDSANEYSLTASPEVDGVTGTRVFFVDQSGVIRLDDASGDPIQ